MTASTLFPPDTIPVIAGPCSAESLRQVLDAARALSAIGIRVFRAGVWKPRTRPGTFEGAGEEALSWIAEAKQSTGMLTATEVATAQHVRLAADAGIDYMWLGARTTANPFAVQEIADAMADLPTDILKGLRVLVKNPVNPDLELWIGAFERLSKAGVLHMGGIHRGFSSYGTDIYRNPPMWRIPIELHRRMPSLPILCDPSHIGGRRELIEPLCHQAVGLDFDGLIIESHCHPDRALSDAAQQIEPAMLDHILRSLPRHQAGASGGDVLGELRRRIDLADDELLEVLSRRMAISREIGTFKKQHSMPVIQTDRYNTLMQQRVRDAAAMGLDENFIRGILAAIHEESVRQQI